ncbi:HD domain-containing protein, partial [bacterium]|nr:HD domain-containing protein [bacterium]
METLIKEIGRIADDEGLEAFVVGGYVRDMLLKRPVKDFDVMVIGDGISFAEKVAEHFHIKTLVVYHNFGTAMLPMGESHDYHKIEFVGARRESYHAESRNPSVEPADLHSDLSRRDFTINAMAMRINKENYGEMIDLFNGKKDLIDTILRTPLDPEETFSDDPLRMMRAIRFASRLQFKIEENTFQGIIKNASRISIISQERITDEFLKMLAGPKPSTGLQLLNDTGLLQHILPELAALNGVEQQQGFLHKDVFKHTLKVVDNISEMTEDIRLRFAALFHDIAKPRTKKFVEGIGWTFYGHEEVGSRMVKGIGKKFKLPNDFYLYVSKIVKLHMRPIQLVDEAVTDSAIRRLIFDGGENIDELLTLCRADITSGNK